jgi:hypothetical protein
LSFGWTRTEPASKKLRAADTNVQWTARPLPTILLASRYGAEQGGNGENNT